MQAFSGKNRIVCVLEVVHAMYIVWIWCTLIFTINAFLFYSVATY